MRIQYKLPIPTYVVLRNSTTRAYRPHWLRSTER